MSFLRHFKAALLFGTPRWVLARAIGYHEAPPVDLAAPVQVVSGRGGR